MITFIYKAATMAATPRPKAPPAMFPAAALVDFAAPELEDVAEDLLEDPEVVPVPVGEAVAPDNKLAPPVTVTGRYWISVGSIVMTDAVLVVSRGMAPVPVKSTGLIVPAGITPVAVCEQTMSVASLEVQWRLTKYWNVSEV
jgi:hypothetical protein